MISVVTSATVVPGCRDRCRGRALQRGRRDWRRTALSGAAPGDAASSSRLLFCPIGPLQRLLLVTGGLRAARPQRIVIEMQNTPTKMASNHTQANVFDNPEHGVESSGKDHNSVRNCSGVFAEGLRPVTSTDGVVKATPSKASELPCRLS